MISVLVVDDEPDFADTLREALQHAGFAAAVCHDGFQALEKLRLNPCDVLITDFMMPGMRGSALIESARRLPHCATRSILMSSFSPSDIQEMYTGHDAYIRKPFGIDTLVGMIGELRAAAADTDSGTATGGQQ